MPYNIYEIGAFFLRFRWRAWSIHCCAQRVNKRAILAEGVIGGAQRTQPGSAKQMVLSTLTGAKVQVSS
jgi:hypothetical protein